MRRFRVEVTGASPLVLQLTAAIGTPCKVVEVQASTEGTTGSVSRPVVSLPSSPGVGSTSLVAEKMSPSSGSPLASVFSSFSSSPSYPMLPPGTLSYAHPYRAMWRGEFWVTNAALLYATSSGVTWRGSLIWEEM